MSISVNCPCGKTYRVGDDKAGLPMKCRECGESIMVPDSESDNEFEAQAPRGPGKNKGRKKSKQSPRSNLPLIASLCLGGVVALGLGGYFLFRGNEQGQEAAVVPAQNTQANPQPVPATPAPSAATAPSPMDVTPSTPLLTSTPPTTPDNVAVPSTPVPKLADHAQAVAALTKLGGRIELDRDQDGKQFTSADFGLVSGQFDNGQLKLLASLRQDIPLRVRLPEGVTDEGLNHVVNLPQLVGLGILGNHVSGEGIQKLRSLKKLQQLIVWSQQVTSQDIETLKTELPACDIQLQRE